MMRLNANFTTTVEAISWVYSSFQRNKENGSSGRDRDVRHPEWTRRILEHLGRPDECGYNIAVTGSKGKGSNAIILAAILQRLGLRVGLFTGPHLVDFMERFRVNGRIIPESTYCKLLEQVKGVVDKLDVPAGQYIGPVGILAAVAALWFREEGTDVNVFECGRGALHDDVNQVTHAGAVLTPVFLEHTWELGPTLTDVVIEKAGVVTPATQWMVCHPQSEQVSSTLALQGWGDIEQRMPGLDFEMRSMISVHATDIELDYPFDEHYVLKLPPCDGYWLRNAAVAFDAARQTWRALGRTQPMPKEIDLTSLRLRGRMDEVREHPLVVVDGTIHADSAHYVSRWIQAKKETGRVNQVGAIVAIPADKDGIGVLSVLRPWVDWVIVTKAHNPHLHFDETLTESAKAQMLAVDEAPYLEDAMALAWDRLRVNDALLVLGTQSFVGDALGYFGAPTQSIWTS
jgi:dihydrofolate synthase / folylpolyglutamate synthase